MLGGVATLVGAIAWITIVVATQTRAQAGLDAVFIAAASAGAWPLGAGAAVMVAGRLIYGHWRTAAPVVNITGEIARTVGLVAAALLGGMLVFLLVSGIDHEDMPAAAALAIGVVLGVGIAQFGGNLRGRGYFD
jgi:hypothetical protein